ncbi:hypothetical protein BI364_07240 [Acidihalobacter yilgarnensis]|uniref:Uncharacterized protein n=1 Tax=Acidihalobacter yilgarnensis TaxID=2819280 RepID=A0A1D8IMY4_9GAMM|nr:hypothetical protein [Acidihalobacter yilgarnensis]AOU97785.1 hypothetical protein BI364_07240 [Acidihalobacter yilgarnensis]
MPDYQELSGLRVDLFDKLLRGFDRHAVLLGRLLGKFSPEAGKLSLNVASAATQADTGMLSIPFPIRFGAKAMPEGLLSIWVFPGELRCGLLLHEELEKLWSSKSREETFTQATSTAWSGNEHHVEGDPVFSVQRRSYSGGRGVMYDWRFTGAFTDPEAWVAALQTDAGAGVFIDAVESRVRHVWFSVAGMLVRGGFDNEVVGAPDADEWFLTVHGPGQPQVVRKHLQEIGAVAEYATPRMKDVWTYVVTSHADPESIAHRLGKGYAVDSQSAPETEKIEIDA